MQVTVDASLLDRFNGAVNALHVPEGARILCAVSGGPDSLALLLLLHETMPNRVVAATVDHALRPESADEAQYVQRFCKDMHVPHVILSPAEKISGNIQSAARHARYALLAQAAEQHDCQYIATAHHADDQLETVLMRIARGSGVDGLSAIRSTNGKILRPLLGFTKDELISICATAGLNPVVDPSNENTDFERVAMRNWLANTPHPFRADRTGRTASALADASEALNWMTETLTQERVQRATGAVRCDARDVPREIQRRLLIHCLKLLEPELAPRGDAIDRLLSELSDGRTATMGAVKCEGGDNWRFTMAPPRRN
ncbi:MAG: tRNA lysidine(34) synthetase TilS [Sphingomonadaceae bacterium PASS1]|nr:MAG: tRNA lysidine(34) synthetase TilS [Sphingomonadaceae bacterium PASS1]